MPDSELDNLIARLCADPACAISPATQIANMPESLPADVRHFFTRCGGGRLYCIPITHEHAVVSAHPDTHGRVYHLSYSLGDPILTFADAPLLASTFTRSLAMHAEVWNIYLRDWREGIDHFRRLIENERHSL